MNKRHHSVPSPECYREHSGLATTGLMCAAALPASSERVPVSSDHLHDRVDAQAGPVADLTDHLTVLQHDDAVAEAHHLVELGGDEDHRHALAGEGGHLCLHVHLGPRSMLRVGSSSTSSRGRMASHRASSTFCWLPPESSPTTASAAPGSRSSRSSRCPSNASTSARATGVRQPRIACSASST